MKQTFYFAQKAFIVQDGHLLAVRKSDDDPHNPGLWEVPGGRMKFGENVDEHLCREVREEVGLEVIPGKPFYVWQWLLNREALGETESIQIVAVARECQVSSGKLDISGQVEDDYLGDASWVPLGTLSELEFIPNMQPVLDAFLKRR